MDERKGPSRQKKRPVRKSGHGVENSQEGTKVTAKPVLWAEPCLLPSSQVTSPPCVHRARPQGLP